MAVDTFQGALPAILPFLKDNLNRKLISLVIGAGGIGVTLPGVIADRFGVLWR